jgi:very-short-patch-repair endonuclease
MHTHLTERALGRLAARQHGVLSLLQLREHGLSDKAIHGRVKSGRLRRLYRGVYAVGPMALTQRGRELAAVLACGEGAALSHHSAAHEWSMMERPSREIHVTCSRFRPPRPGIVVHRSPLGELDRVVLNGIPVTTVARTIVDFADVATDDELVGLVDRAEARRIFNLAEIRAAQERAPNRRGRHKLERVLRRWQPPPFTRAESERLFLALCKRYELPRPMVNVWLGEQEVDFYWEAQRVVVEVDGGSTHMTRRAFEEDRRRDRRLAVMGILVLRVTWRDLHHRQAEVAGQLNAVLAARSPC